MNTRLTWIATPLVLALVALPSAVVAQQQPRQKTQPTLREAVAACVVIVRKQTDERLGVKYSDFDAYVKSDGMVVWFGTAKERFSFEKCMNEKGHPLK